MTTVNWPDPREDPDVEPSEPWAKDDDDDGGGTGGAEPESDPEP